MIDNASLKSKNIEKKCLPLFAKAIDLLCYRNLQLSHEKNPLSFSIYRIERSVYLSNSSHYSLIEKYFSKFGFI